jgi:uracil-DNA glycosylase
MDLDSLSAQITRCRRCPRLVAWREQVATEKRAAYEDEEYWGKPVPGFGDPSARLLVLGLAPGAHGANRTGRMFTGDRSGDWLFRAMFNTGFANQPASHHRGDGLELIDAWVTAPVRCAPPDNKPLVAERDNCRPWLHQELDLLPDIRVILCLGGFAWTNAHQVLEQRGISVPKPRPAFTHGARSQTSGPTILASYHVSQQNTFTGRLTEEMLEEVFEIAKAELGSRSDGRRAKGETPPGAT